MLSSKYLVYSSIDLDLQASKQPKCPENQNRMILKALSNSKWQLSLVRHIAACSTGRALNPWNMLLFISNTTILISIWIFMMIQFAMNAFSIHGIIWSWRDWMSRLEAHRIEASELLAARRGLVLAPLRIAKTSDFSILKSPNRKLIGSVVPWPEGDLRAA